MSAAHLHAVPEPEPDEEPDPGEQATPPPDQGDTEPTGRGIATVPDLRPYLDVRPLGPMALTAARLGGPPLLRAVRRGLLVLGRGVRVLSALAAEWLSGRIGNRGSALARIGIALAALYGVGRTAASHPAGPWVAAGGLLIVVLLAGLGRLPRIGAPKPAEERRATAPVGRRRGSLVARFARRTPTPEAPAADPPAAPSEPPLTALIRELIGADNGVHLAVLRPAMRERLPGLSGASDAALRNALSKAGFDPSRTFRAGGIAGRAGVHRSQLPPLSPETPSGHSPPHSPHVRPANSPRAEGGGEGAGERSPRGIRYVRDPELGPAAWRIEHDGRTDT
jgi:hypothetical protein